MTESSVQDTAVAAPGAAKPKKSPAPKAKKTAAKKAAPTHPPTATMVNAAIKSLKERGGSSLQAIKKYISGTYKVDAEKIAPFIKKYLKSAVDSGTLIRTKGQGASGSFKLAAEVAKPKKKPAAPKPKSAAAKKTPKPKKEKATPKKAAAKPKAAKPKAAAVKKSPAKAKKAVKPAVTKKPKSPKPKKAAPKKVTKKPAAKK